MRNPHDVPVLNDRLRCAQLLAAATCLQPPGTSVKTCLHFGSSFSHRQSLRVCDIPAKHISRRAGNTVVPTDDSQAQTPAECELTDFEDSHSFSDEEEQPGPSGLGQQTEPAATAGSTATTPASATDTQLTPTQTDTAATANDNGTATHSTLELTDDSSTVNEEEGSGLTVPPQTVHAFGGRGGGRGRVDPRHRAAGDDNDQPNLSRVPCL